jgi:hypothetical protein
VLAGGRAGRRTIRPLKRFPEVSRRLATCSPEENGVRGGARAPMPKFLDLTAASLETLGARRRGSARRMGVAGGARVQETRRSAGMKHVLAYHYIYIYLNKYKYCVPRRRTCGPLPCRCRVRRAPRAARGNAAPPAAASCSTCSNGIRHNPRSRFVLNGRGGTCARSR